MAAQTEGKRKTGLKRLEATVTEVERPTDDLVLLSLTRPGGADYEFKAGQFLYVFLPDSDEKKPYSIASAPHETDRLDLCVKKVEGGPLSTYLYGLDSGDGVAVSRALGGFVLKSPPGRTYAGLATGTGVAPLRSMIRQLLHDGDRRDIWLFLGSSNRHNLPYHPEWEALARREETFHYVPTCSREGMEWTGERGWIQEPFTNQFLHRDDFDVYLCGIKRMVDDVNHLLQTDLGLDRTRIHLEKYV